ncbi:hypothetical protein GCM10027277_55150 [Pseudoduganella ginsengisoli]|uniref:DUF4214 domain-containing protein n=1 Tax=Pseudoduganella ginsengisoli TaxID=1462440 RepID=A0A6L6Q746_9BURK|nr:DUF4214 domain-containing protein [Pseudoduganella ginsengisoli]MTW04952.1 DUF4214 domain-containing protein [Pseudoduganella ginsengisoli]
MSVIASKIDLSKYSGAVFDQGDQNSCTANAIAQAIRLQTREYHKDSGELAREQLYYDARTLWGNVSTDTGVPVHIALNAAMSKGIADQAVALPYSGTHGTNSSMFVQPSSSVYANAATQKLVGYTNLEDHFNYVNGDRTKGFEFNVANKQAHLQQVIGEYLMEGKPVIFSAEVPVGIASLSGPLASQNYFTFAQSSPEGFHTMVIVGKDDNLHGGSYIVENSWGTGWGANGLGYIPYNQFGTAAQSESGYRLTGLAVAYGLTNGSDGINLEWTAQRKEVAQLYATLLDRAADHSGLEYWAGTMKAGQSINAIANFMYSSGEVAAKYGSLTDAAFVNEMYINTMGHAADAGGKAYWADLITRKVISRGEFAVTLMNNVENTTGAAGSPSIAEHDYLMNRTAVSANFAITYQIDSHTDIGAWAVDNVTSDANSVQATLVGIQSMMGWA